MYLFKVQNQIHTLTFTSICNEHISFRLKNKSENIFIKYDRNKEIFSCPIQNELSGLIKENVIQLKKIIHSALKGRTVPGQTICFAFIRDFPFLKDEDFNHYIRLDRRKSELSISVCKKETAPIYKIYADGSYATEKSQSGYAGIIIDTMGKMEPYHSVSQSKSSNEMELLAVLEGLRRLKHIDKIQVNTDSRFVIRGLIQWMHFWRLNNWHTAQALKVKYAKYWKELDKITNGKFLEIKWIKAHSGDENHTICHQKAKQIATMK